MSTVKGAGELAPENMWTKLFAQVATCPEAQDDLLGPLCGNWTPDLAARKVEALLTIVECGDRQKAICAAEHLHKFVVQRASAPPYAARFYSVLEAAACKYIALDDADAAAAMAITALNVYWPDEGHKTVGALLELAVQSAIHDSTFGNAVVRKTLALSRNVNCSADIDLQLCGAWTKLVRHGVDVRETLGNVMVHCEKWMVDIRMSILHARRKTVFPAGTMAVTADLLAAVPLGTNMYYTTMTLWELLADSDNATLQAVMNSNNGYLKTRMLKVAQGESSRRVASRIGTIDAYAATEAEKAAKEADTAAREAALAAAEARAEAAEKTVARIKEHVRQLLAFGGVSIGDVTTAETSGMTADHFSRAGDGGSIGAGDGALGSATAADAVPADVRPDQGPDQGPDQCQGPSTTENVSAAGC
jgi:hypothetical protein